MALPMCPHGECYDDHGDWEGCRYDWTEDQRPAWTPDDEEDFFEEEEYVR